MTRRWVDLTHVGLLVGQVLASPPRFSKFGYVKKREKRGECQVPGPYFLPSTNQTKGLKKKDKERSSISGEKIFKSRI